MGCGCGSKRATDVYEENETPGNPEALASQLNKVKEKKENKETIPPEMQNTTLLQIQPSVIDGSRINDTGSEINNTCAQCEDPDSKKYALSCSHGFCAACAKQQTENQLKKKRGNIEFFCHICRAPKNLSTS